MWLLSFMWIDINDAFKKYFYSRDHHTISKFWALLVILGDVIKIPICYIDSYKSITLKTYSKGFPSICLVRITRQETWQQAHLQLYRWRRGNGGLAETLQRVSGLNQGLWPALGNEWPNKMTDSSLCPSALSSPWSLILFFPPLSVLMLSICHSDCLTAL